jgi:phytoene synthase
MHARAPEARAARGAPAVAEAADLAACRAALRVGSRSFHLAAHLLPTAVADAAAALYAFCRQADDAVDVPDRADDALPRLWARLDAAYAGRPEDEPVDRAFAATVAAYGVPRALPAALLEGMGWDAEGRRPRTLSDVLAYSARVAASVGAMMSVVMGRTAPTTVARACDLGIAMQLSNIARDVGEDARLGRLYLPTDWFAEAGLDADAWLAAPRPEAAVTAMIERLLATADPLYARAATGIAALPRRCRPGIHLARRVYAEIGEEVRRRDHDSVSRRAVVPTRRKLALLAPALVDALRRPAVDHAPPLEETRFLVDAAVAARPGVP